MMPQFINLKRRMGNKAVQEEGAAVIRESGLAVLRESPVLNRHLNRNCTHKPQTWERSEHLDGNQKQPDGRSCLSPTIRPRAE
jgi:hypothetical protein